MGTTLSISAACFGLLDEAEVLIDQTTNDSVELLKVSISPKMVMKELSRVLTESADLLIVLTQDFGLRNWTTFYSKTLNN